MDVIMIQNTISKKSIYIKVIWLTLPLIFSTITVISFLFLFSPVKVSKAEMLFSGMPEGREIVQAGGDLTITKTHSGNFSIGKQGTYLINISNIGIDPITGTITVVDKLPGGFSLVSSSGGAGWSPCSPPAGQNVTCVYSPTTPVNGGTSISALSIVVNVPITSATLVTNTVDVTNPNDINPDNNQDLDPTILTYPDLSVTKEVYPSTAGEGAVITYTLTVKNNGLSDATSVELIDTLPVTITYISYSTTVGSYNSTTGKWDIGSLNNGVSVVLHIKGRVKSGIGEKVITNVTQGLTSSLPDYNQSNNQSTVDLNSQKRADLVLSKTDYCGSASPGDVITYTVFVTNTGTISATQVIITDVLQSYFAYITDTLRTQGNVTFTNPSAGTYIWKLPKIDPLSAYQYKLRLKLASPLPSGTTTIVNTVQATTSATEDNKDNNLGTDTSEAREVPNISITESVSPSEAKANQSFTFSIVVKNNGSYILNNVVVKDTYSSYLSITSVSKTKGTHVIDTATRTVSVDLGTLSSGESATITIVAYVSSSATSTTNLTDTSTVTFRYNCRTYTHSSNTVSFRILGTSTLPGTGGKPAEFQENVNRKASAGFWAALISSVLLGLLGLSAFLYAVRIKKTRPEWFGWLVRMSVFLVGVAVVFGIGAWGLNNLSGIGIRQARVIGQRKIPVLTSTAPLSSLVPESIFTFQDHETLPDYPVPTPGEVANQTEDMQPKDTTSPARLVIPALGVDTIIKYVPFDGFTWLIQGLQWEVAWMGSTSWPGLGSNTGLAGHVTLRNGSDGPFKYLDTLANGSEIIVYTEKNIFTYHVREQRTSSDTDFSVISATDKPVLTLITCTDWDTNFRAYLQRLVVIADLAEVKPLAVSMSGN